MYESSKTLVKRFDKIGDKLANVVEDFQINNFQETVEVETEIDLIAEAETTQETTTGIEVETTTETEVQREERVETTVEIEAEVETGLIHEMGEEINQDLDQVKDTLKRMSSVTTATEQVIKHIDVSDWKLSEEKR